MRLILLYITDSIIPKRTHRLLALCVIDTNRYGRPRTCLDCIRSIFEVLGVVRTLTRSFSHARAVSDELDQVLVCHFLIQEHTLQFLA